MRGLFLLLLLTSSALHAADEANIFTREERTVQGWRVLIATDLLSAEKKAKTDRALELLDIQLQEIVRVVPAAAVAEMKKVTLYFSPVYPGAGARAEYHPDAGWLRANKRDPVMAKQVEFTDVHNFEEETKRMPNFTLHELAHAYHDRVLGFGQPDIVAAYKKAKASGSYNNVDIRDALGRVKKGKSYAMTNEKEYFAEVSEAFFSRNDIYPFTRDELKQHDPDAFAVLEKVWNQKPAQEAPKP